MYINMFIDKLIILSTIYVDKKNIIENYIVIKNILDIRCNTWINSMSIFEMFFHCFIS